MKYHRWNNNDEDKILKRWELRFLLILIILLIMLTVIDLNLSLDQILKFFIS
jgi:hypothetical protein